MPLTYGVDCCNCVMMSSDLHMCICNCHFDKVPQGVLRRKIAKWRDSKWIKKNRPSHSFSSVKESKN
jgi:hypothetical protein